MKKAIHLGHGAFVQPDNMEDGGIILSSRTRQPSIADCCIYLDKAAIAKLRKWLDAPDSAQ